MRGLYAMSVRASGERWRQTLKLRNEPNFGGGGGSGARLAVVEHDRVLRLGEEQPALDEDAELSQRRREQREAGAAPAAERQCKQREAEGGGEARRERDAAQR